MYRLGITFVSLKNVAAKTTFCIFSNFALHLCEFLLPPHTRRFSHHCPYTLNVYLSGRLSCLSFALSLCFCSHTVCAFHLYWINLFTYVECRANQQTYQAVNESVVIQLPFGTKEQGWVRTAFSQTFAGCSGYAVCEVFDSFCSRKGHLLQNSRSSSIQ